MTHRKFIPTSPIASAALISVMTALVFVATYSFRISFPATGGYFNFGDIMIFVGALTFGPIVGGFAGGVGSSLADVASGSANFAPFTLVVKGLEGLVAGLIATRRFRANDILGWLAGGSIMVTGYFLTGAFLYGLPAAIFPELPGDVVQMVSGGLLGIPLSRVLQAKMPPNVPRIRSSTQRADTTEQRA